MAEDLVIEKSGTKTERYLELIPQIEALLKGEDNVIANMANICAALKEAFDFFWVGFYLVDGDELVLGPFQGPVACTRILKGKGVCGAAWSKSTPLIVEDVNQFPGHIACSALSVSEIVIPFKDVNDNITGVLDVDSTKQADFDEIDHTYLKIILDLL